MITVVEFVETETETETKEKQLKEFIDKPSLWNPNRYCFKAELWRFFWLHTNSSVDVSYAIATSKQKVFDSIDFSISTPVEVSLRINVWFAVSSGENKILQFTPNPPWGS